MLHKYRAWDIKEKTMLYDDDTMQYGGKERKNIWVTNRGITYDILNAHNDYVTVCKNGKKEDFYNSWDYSAFRHEALIIMQASPWFDKKKMRVFEGDILQIETTNHKP